MGQFSLSFSTFNVEALTSWRLAFGFFAILTCSWKWDINMIVITIILYIKIQHVFFGYCSAQFYQKQTFQFNKFSTEFWKHDSSSITICYRTEVNDKPQTNSWYNNTFITGKWFIENIIVYNILYVYIYIELSFNLITSPIFLLTFSFADISIQI